MKYRKKTPIVDAVQWFVGDKNPFPEKAKLRDNQLWIMTASGSSMKVGNGEWVICGDNGDLYPCESRTFERNYEPVGLF